MAIIANKSTEIGDVIVIKTGVPVVGIVALTGFMDNTENEGQNKFFEKTFRYSNDGVSFSDWLDLTQENIEGITFDISDTFIIEYNYRRSGVDNTSDLVFNSITLEGEFAEPICGSAYSNSMFADFIGDCNNLCTLNWSINVLEKLYSKGILPEYITRGNNSSNLEDKDFVDFWRSITHYFAWFVCLARKFANFHNDEDLLREYLNQRNLITCSSTPYLDLLYLRANYLDEIRQRGTIQIAKPKGIYTSILDESISGSESDSDSNSEVQVQFDKQVDGELLRLLCYQVEDEFLFDVVPNELLGWNIDNSSPLYRSKHKHLNLNKSYEDETSDLNKYPLVNSSGISIIEESGLKTIRIQSGSSIGGILDLEKSILVNTSLDYEITFEIKGGGQFTFGVEGFDLNSNSRTLKEYLGADKNTFCESESLNRNDMYYPIRGYIYKIGSPLDLQSVLNTGFGNHLQFKNNGIFKIIPQIHCVSGEIFIRNLKINPINTPFSDGFIQSPNHIHIWGVNRNLDLSESQQYQKIRRYLVPYDSVSEVIYLQQNTQV